eukprot:s5655_g3.t1
MQWRQRFLVQSKVNHVCRRLSSEIYACFYGITYMLSEDAFNHRMEILISSTKEGKVVINSGFYSETAMKNELNFSKLLAYLWYSANTRTLGKRDKYQPDIKEYWVDTSTVGSLSTSHKEQFNQYIEILDPDCSMPVPLLENSPKPDYEREDDDDQHDDASSSGVDEEEATPSATKSKKHKKKKSKSTPSPKTRSTKRAVLKRAEKKAKESREEEIEAAREAGVVSVVVFLYVTKDDDDYEDDESDDEPAKVSDKLLCNIAAGFMDECRDADPDVANELASSGLLADLRRQSKTGHENETGKVFEKRGLALPVPLTYIDLGKEKKHPVLKVSDMLQVLAEKNKLQLFWGSTKRKTRSTNLNEFWSRYRHQDAGHAIFEQHDNRLDRVLPLQIHADEGETLKKSGVMIINFQSPMGFGISTADDADDAMALNYTGNTYSTRFLFTVCTKRSYSKKNKFVLDSILESLADELKDLFLNGVSLQVGKENMTMYVATIGLKGDWPVQARIGHLTRHFSKKGVYKTSSKSGFCHLCRAGETNYPPYDYTRNAAWRASYLTRAPWVTEGPLCRIPQSTRKELMHKFDVFHTCHKGVFAELAGSGLDCQSCIVKLCTTTDGMVEMKDSHLLMDYSLVDDITLIMVDSLVANPLVRLSFDDPENLGYEAISGSTGTFQNSEEVTAVNSGGKRGVNFDGRGCLLLPQAVQLGSEWTISVWTLAPIDVAARTYRDLIDSPNSQELIAVILARGRLGRRLASHRCRGPQPADLVLRRRLEDRLEAVAGTRDHRRGGEQPWLQRSLGRDVGLSDVRRRRGRKPDKGALPVRSSRWLRTDSAWGALAAGRGSAKSRRRGQQQLRQRNLLRQLRNRLLRHMDLRGQFSLLQGLCLAKRLAD